MGGFMEMRLADRVARTKIRLNLSETEGLGAAGDLENIFVHCSL